VFHGLRLSDGATIAVKAGGEALGFIQSELFCATVFEVFVGELLSEDAKFDVIRSLKLFRRRESRKSR
jgi:hypothetical protein